MDLCHLFGCLESVSQSLEWVLPHAREDLWRRKAPGAAPGATCVYALPPGGALAEPPYACLLPSSHLLAVAAGRHAG